MRTQPKAKKQAAKKASVPPARTIKTPRKKFTTTYVPKENKTERRAISSMFGTKEVTSHMLVPRSCPNDHEHLEMNEDATQLVCQGCGREWNELAK